jgi:HSP20 family protein
MRAPLRDMHHMIDDVIRSSFSDLTMPTYPYADVSETGENYTVTAEVPGLKKEDIQLRVQENILSLRINKQAQKDEETRTYRHVERFYGTFERHFPFASSIDPNRVKATYKDGLLEIVLPKAESARARNVDIEIK